MVKATKQSRFIYPELSVADIDWHRVPLTALRRVAGSSSINTRINHPVTGNLLIHETTGMHTAHGKFADKHPMFDWLAENATGRWIVASPTTPLESSVPMPPIPDTTKVKKTLFLYEVPQLGRTLTQALLMIEDATDETLFRAAFGEHVRR